MDGELIIRRMVCARVPTAVGEFQLCLYENNLDNKEHLAFIKGDIEDKNAVLTRIHSECFTGDVLGSRRCDCGEQLEIAMEKIAQEGSGVIIYLRQEGRGIGLLNKLRAYNLQDEGQDTVQANISLGHQPDERDYSMAAAILKDLNVHSVRLLTNNPSKISGLSQLGINVDDRIPLIPTVFSDNEAYLLTKVKRMHHLYEIEPIPFLMHNDNGHHR